MVLWEKKLSYVFCFAQNVFKWCRTASASFYFFFSSVNYRRIYSVHLKNLRFAEDVLFYPKNEVMAFPKIKIKWDWVSDVHVYIKSNAVIWFWRYCHVRTRQTSENQITDRKCVVQTNSRVKWRWFYSGMSEFNCLVVVLFSAMFSCFLLDSFELQEMVCLTKHGATFSSLNISRRYDEHACDTVFFSLSWKLKN